MAETARSRSSVDTDYLLLPFSCERQSHIERQARCVLLVPLFTKLSQISGLECA